MRLLKIFLMAMMVSSIFLYGCVPSTELDRGEIEQPVVEEEKEETAEEEKEMLEKIPEIEEMEDEMEIKMSVNNRITLLYQFYDPNDDFIFELQERYDSLQTQFEDKLRDIGRVEF